MRKAFTICVFVLGGLCIWSFANVYKKSVTKIVHKLLYSPSVVIFSVQEHGEECSDKFRPFDTVCVICPDPLLHVRCMIEALNHQRTAKSLHTNDLLIISDDWTLFNPWTQEDILDAFEKSGHAILFSSQNLDVPHIGGNLPSIYSDETLKPFRFPNSDLYMGTYHEIMNLLVVADDLAYELLKNRVAAFDEEPNPKAAFAVPTNDFRKDIQSHSKQYIFGFLILNAYSDNIGIDHRMSVGFTGKDVTCLPCPDGKSENIKTKASSICTGGFVDGSIDVLSSFGDQMCQLLPKMKDKKHRAEYPDCHEEFEVLEDQSIRVQESTTVPFAVTFSDDSMRSTFESLRQSQLKISGPSVTSLINYKATVRRPFLSEIVRKHLVAYHEQHPEYGGLTDLPELPKNLVDEV